MSEGRLKIAIIGDRGIPARYSGFSTLVEQLAVRLVRDHDMDVSVYCRNSYYDEKPKYYEGVRCYYFSSPGGKNFESIIHSNISIFHASFSSYDLVFIVDPGNAPFAWPLNLRFLPTVFHTDGMGWKRRKWSPLQQKYYKWSEGVCARLATALVTDSRAMQDYYLSEYNSPSSFIPYSGEVGENPDDQGLKKLGLEKNGYYLVVARVEPENNVDLIIKEYKASGVTRPLVVVGGSRYESEYSKLVMNQASEKVLCAGAIFESETLNGLYQNCYAYLHGHEVGGTNPSLLRAMHWGAACVPINVVFHREVMGEEGLFFENAGGHLAGILNELENDSVQVQKLGHLAKERSETLYRWDAVAAGYAEMFRKVVSARKNGGNLQNVFESEVYRPEEFLQK